MQLDLHLLKHNKSKQKHQLEPIFQEIRQQQFNNRYSITERSRHYEALNDPYTSYYFANPSVKNHLKVFKKALRDQHNETQRSKINKLITLRIKEKFHNYICPKTLIYEKELTSLELKVLAKKSSATLNKKKSKQSLLSSITDEDRVNKVLGPKRRYFPSVKHQLTPLNATVSQQFASVPEPVSPKTEKQAEVSNFGSKTASKEKRNDSVQRKPTEINEAKVSVQPIRSPKVQTKKTETNRSEHQHMMKTTMKENDQVAFANRLAQDLHKKKHEKWVKFLQQKRIMLQKGIQHQHPQSVDQK